MLARARHAVVMAAKDELGRAGERRAAEHLSAVGYTVVDRNWRNAQGEIDIVALRGGDVCFVEVKTRSTPDFGHPFEAIDERKRRRMWALAFAWAIDHPEVCSGRALRLQAIGIIGRDPASGTLEHLADLS